jgi:prepilin-type processing-associated H-X9-DG protein
MEQDNLHKTVNFNVGANTAANNGPRGQKVPILLCPSDSYGGLPVGFGGNSYAANYGNDIHWAQSNTNGVFYFSGPNIQGAAFADIIDGTSNTAAFCERRLGDFNNAVMTERTDLFQPTSGGIDPANADAAYQACQTSIDMTNFGNQFRSDYGGYWIQGFHMTLYTHAGPPNVRGCAFPPRTMLMVANSNHPGGVNLLLCDGSVRFVRNSINILTWRAVGSKDGGEVLGNDW